MKEVISGGIKPMLAGDSEIVSAISMHYASAEEKAGAPAPAPPAPAPAPATKPMAVPARPAPAAAPAPAPSLRRVEPATTPSGGSRPVGQPYIPPPIPSAPLIPQIQLDQQKAISDWWTKRQQIETKMGQSLNDENDRYEQQRGLPKRGTRKEGEACGAPQKNAARFFGDPDSPLRTEMATKH